MILEQTSQTDRLTGISKGLTVMMNWWNKWEISRTEPGSLYYSETGKRYRFPVYEEEGEIVFVAYPTAQQNFFLILFNGWKKVPLDLAVDEIHRIIGRVIAHFEQQGRSIRVLERNPDEEDAKFEFHPELFDHRSQAMELLTAAGITWMSDFSSIAPLHEEFGLEVCGIHEEEVADKIVKVMIRHFPHWHFTRICLNDGDIEPGWKLSIHMFPSRGCAGGSCG